MRPQPRFPGHRRPIASARVGRTRPELAAELVRLEYERTRLERTLESLDSRRATIAHQLTVLRERAEWIQGCLAEVPEHPPEPPPAPPHPIRRSAVAKPAELHKRRPRG